jgi:hypothetical protein
LARPNDTEDERAERARRRRNGFALHLAAYFALIALVVPLNLFLIAPDTPWFLLPMVGWGAVLAVHCAFAMGLFALAPSERR